MDMTDKLITEIKQCKTRDEVVEHYKNALYITGIDWSQINKVLIEKWSVSGLRYIKMNAWR